MAKELIVIDEGDHPKAWRCWRILKGIKVWTPQTGLMIEANKLMIEMDKRDAK